MSEAVKEVSGTIAPSVRRRLSNPALGPLNDFKVAATVVWKHLKLPKLTASQREVCDWLQQGSPEFDLDDPKRNRQIITAFRGIGKTWITATFVCWCLLMDVDLRILIVSKSGPKAQEIAEFIRKLIEEVPIFQHLKPGKESKDTIMAFTVTGARPDVAPSVKALGVDGQLPGNRADIIIPDDVETLQNAMTQLQRDRLGVSVKEFDAILKPGGLVVYLGTPQVEESLYNTLATERGYTIRIWPARWPTPAQMNNQKYASRLAPSVRDKWSADKSWKVREVERFSEEDMLARELSYGKSGFMLQFMLDTSLSDADRYPLKLRDLIVAGFTAERVPVAISWGCDTRTAIKGEDLPCIGMSGDRYYRPIFTSEHWVELDEIVMSIDPSGRGADETAYAVVGSCKGMLYLLASGGFQGGYEEETLIQLAKVAEAFKVHRVIPEDNFGGGMFTQLLKPVLHRYHKCEVVEDFRSKGQKEHRICDILEPVIGSHRLVVLEDVIRKDFQPNSKDSQLFYQLTRMSRQKGALKFDDRIDALAMAVGWFTQRMAQEVQDMEAQHKRERQLKHIEDFLAAYDAQQGWSQDGSEGLLKMLKH